MAKFRLMPFNTIWEIYPRRIVVLVVGLILIAAITVTGAVRSPVPMSVRTTGITQTWTAGDTLHILAIRVEFQPDNLPTTIGDGTFGTGFPDEMFVDPLPHDRQYFEDHLLFVKNYYEEVSNHRLIVGRMDVFPAELDEAYRLPKFMWQYNYNYTTEVLDQQLAELFHHAWLEADTAGLFNSVDVDDYNAFVVFHAGVGKDFAVGFDPTPFDIPSAYLNLDHLRNNLTIPSEGIPVTSGFIPDGLILPESEVQEGYELGLNGVMTKLFGNMLGIPDLYDTRNGRSGIGRWGMMDQGSGNFQALIPARPCPWTLADMGWIDPIVLNPGDPDTLMIASVMVADTTIPQYYQVPINDQEYFLVENRRKDFRDWDFTRAWDRDGRVMRLFDDYSVEVDPGFRVVVRVDDYDFDIPGSGILIWHVDEAVIAANRADNAVNATDPHRGVDVEEADGAEDIGQEYGLFSAGWGQEYGSPWDCFFKDNEAHLEANNSTVVRFTDFTAPWARANSGALSHISFRHFSLVDTVMTFVLSQGFRQGGFPVITDYPIVANSELLLDVTGDGVAEVVVMDSTGRLLAFRGDGTGLGVAGDGVLTQVSTGDEDGIFRTAAGDLDGDFVPEIVVCGLDSTWIFTLVDSNQVEEISRWDAGGMPLIGGTYGDRVIFVASGGEILIGDYTGALRWRSSYPAGLITGMALYADPDSVTVAVVYDQGEVVGVQYDVDLGFGAFVWRDTLSVMPGEITYAPVAGDLDGDGYGEIVVVSEQGFFVIKIAVLENENPVHGPFPSSFPVELTSPPTLADLDRDGTLEIIIAGRGVVYAFHYNGSLVNNFPIYDNSWLGNGMLQSSVLLADLTGDGNQELLLVGDSGNLTAFDLQGNRIDGFPLSAGIGDFRTPVIGQIDGDSDMEMLVGTSSGLLQGWNLETGGDVTTSEMAWWMWGRNNARTNLVMSSTHEPPSPGGSASSNWTYCWPNPSYDETSFVRVTLPYSADVEVRIFDMAGELVGEIQGRANPRAPVDIPWNLRDIQSGVYFARVEAQGGSRNDLKILKVAVIK